MTSLSSDIFSDRRKRIIIKFSLCIIHVLSLRDSKMEGVPTKILGRATLSHNIHIQILQTDLHTFPYTNSWENLLKDQSILPEVIILFIFINFSFNHVLILLGENWCWLLLGRLTMETNVREEIIKWQNYSFLSNKYSSSSISNVINNKNKLWKPVRLTSFQKPTTTIRFNLLHVWPSVPYFVFAVLFIPSSHVLEKLFLC